MDKAALAVQAVFIFTLLAGLTVLWAAVQATRDERRYESAMLRTFGATRNRVLGGVATEFLAIGLLAGVLVFKLAPEAEGHGTDAVINAYHRKGALLRPRIIPVKLIASALTIGSGGSAGREGPVAHISAGFASYMSQLLRLPTLDRRILVICGMAAGIGGMFRAPLGAALFAIEVLYSENDYESEALIPAIIPWQPASS